MPDLYEYLIYFILSILASLWLGKTRVNAWLGCFGFLTCYLSHIEYAVRLLFDCFSRFRSVFYFVRPIELASPKTFTSVLMIVGFILFSKLPSSNSNVGRSHRGLLVFVRE